MASLSIGSAFAQSPCTFFKTGKFENLENGVVKSTLERNDSIQIETRGDIEIKLAIEWLDECTYKLVFLEGNQAFWDSRPEDMATPDLIVEMGEIVEHTYKQRARMVDEDDFFYESTVMKIAN